MLRTMEETAFVVIFHSFKNHISQKKYLNHGQVTHMNYCITLLLNNTIIIIVVVVVVIVIIIICIIIIVNCNVVYKLCLHIIL